MTTSQEPPKVGDYVMDTRRKCVGVLMDRVGARYQLRPPEGGREWDADPSAVRLATTEERLRHGVKVTNNRSARGGIR